MEQYPPISIVVLNYNGLNFLQTTIQPLCGLNYPNFEIIIVDNGSKDESLRFLEQFKVKWTNKRIEFNIIKNKDNLGYSKGKNIGIKNAKGDYILLLDEDILIQNKSILKELYREYTALKNTGFLSILLQEGDEKYTTFYGGYMSRFNFYKNKKVDINKIVGGPTFESVSPDGGAIFFSRAFFMDIGLFDESQPYYIDVGDVGIRSILRGYKNYIFCKDYFVHLGKSRKENNENWCWKYKYCFSGMSRIILKNDSGVNLMIRLPYLIIFFFIKTLKQFIVRLNFCVLSSFFYSILLFIKNLPDTLSERRENKTKRKIKKDIFLRILPPKFN